jgi:hypothetical protein
MKVLGPRTSTVVLFFWLILSSLSTKAFAADITVSAPASGSIVASPFLLRASSSTCQTQPTASMAYSFDSGSDTIFSGATSINTNVSASQGTHTLRVKSWGNSGAFCEKDIAITVGTGVQVTAPLNGTTVPSSFLLQASAPTCGGQNTSSMAYSFDSNADNLLSGATSINQTVTDTAGTHILRVKAWGNGGAFCETNLNITISTQSIVVSTPSNNATVATTFLLQAQAPTCSGASTSSMAYSFDSLSDNLLSGQQSINQNVTAPSTGAHTLRVKAWNVNGALCETDESLNVSSTASDITITNPTDPNVAISFPLQAQAPTCQGVATSSMAYSFDSLSDHLFSGQTSINTTATAPSTGAHLLRVKAWNTSGALCEKQMDLNVINNGLVPGSTANAYSRIELFNNYTGSYASCPPGSAGSGVGGATSNSFQLWLTQPDCGTVGSKSGTTNVTSPPAPPQSGDTQVRQYTMNYDGSNGAGVRWFNELSNSSSANDDVYLNFQYDVWVYFDQTSIDHVYNLEMDLNQTVGSPAQYLYIFATQCNMVKGHWQLGNGWPLTADQTCTRSQFQPGWHHVQIQFHRSSTTITFDAEAIDGVVQNFTCNNGGACTVSVPSGTSWGTNVLGPNFQLDGITGGSTITGYADQFTIYRW